MTSMSLPVQIHGELFSVTGRPTPHCVRRRGGGNVSHTEGVKYVKTNKGGACGLSCLENLVMTLRGFIPILFDVSALFVF